MEKYTREQLEIKLKVVNDNNKKDLAKQIKEFNLTKTKKVIYA
jgi:hypothetical protein